MLTKKPTKPAARTILILLILILPSLAATIEIPEIKINTNTWHSPYDYHMLFYNSGYYYRHDLPANAFRINTYNKSPIQYYQWILITPNKTEKTIYTKKWDTLTITRTVYTYPGDQYCKQGCPKYTYYSDITLPAQNITITEPGKYTLELRKTTINRPTAEAYPNASIGDTVYKWNAVLLNINPKYSYYQLSPTSYQYHENNMYTTTTKEEYQLGKRLTKIQNLTPEQINTTLAAFYDLTQNMTNEQALAWYDKNTQPKKLKENLQLWQKIYENIQAGTYTNKKPQNRLLPHTPKRYQLTPSSAPLTTSSPTEIYPDTHPGSVCLEPQVIILTLNPPKTECKQTEDTLISTYTKYPQNQTKQKIQEHTQKGKQKLLRIDPTRGTYKLGEITYSAWSNYHGSDNEGTTNLPKGTRPPTAIGCKYTYTENEYYSVGYGSSRFNTWNTNCILPTNTGQKIIIGKEYETLITEQINITTPTPATQVFQPTPGNNQPQPKHNNNQKWPANPTTTTAAAAATLIILLKKRKSIQTLKQQYKQTQTERNRIEQLFRKARQQPDQYIPEVQKLIKKWRQKIIQDSLKRLETTKQKARAYLQKHAPPLWTPTPPTATTQPHQNHKPTTPTWPTTIYSQNNTYTILTPITPNTTQILIQNTKTGQLYTLPITTNKKNKSIKYNWKNAKQHKPKHKITITLPNNSTIKHNNTQALKKYLQQKITPTNKITNYTKTPGMLTITLQKGTTITITKPNQAFLEWFQKTLQYPNKYQKHPYNKFTHHIQTAQWQKAAELLARHWQQTRKTTNMTQQEITKRLQLAYKMPERTCPTPFINKQIWNNPQTLITLTQKQWEQTQKEKEENKEKDPREEFRQKLNAKQASLKEYQKYLNTVEKIYGTKYASRATIKVDASVTLLEGIKIRIWNRYTQTTILDTTGHFTKELPQEGKIVPPDSTQQLTLPPGTYNIQIDAPRHASQIHQITILDGEHTTITIKLKELYPPPRTNTLLDPIIDLISGRRSIQEQLGIEQQTNWLADNLGQDPFGTGKKTIIIWPGTETIITEAEAAKLLTDHAIQRAAERGISKEKIIDVLINGRPYFDTEKGSILRIKDNIAVVLKKESTSDNQKIAIVTVEWKSNIGKRYIPL